jgi:hypothetical protein
VEDVLDRPHGGDRTSEADRNSQLGVATPSPAVSNIGRLVEGKAKIRGPYVVEIHLGEMGATIPVMQIVSLQLR